MTCNTCHWWQPYTQMLSYDGKEFEIGHCSQGRGLTADDYRCSQYKDIEPRDDASPPTDTGEDHG